jgi:uncharacterized protein (DUF2225 family)
MGVRTAVLSRRTFHRALGALAATAVVGADRVALAHTSQEVSLRCPIDGTSIKVHETMSMTTFGAFKDFQKKGAIGSYYEDQVAACPTCRFAGFAADFAAPVKPETVKWIKNDLRQKWAGRGTPTQAEENELAADRYTFETAKSETIGQLWLVASYLMRGATGQRADQRKTYQRASARFFTSALAAGEVKADTRAPMIYLVAELERRVGDHAQAIVHYDAALAEAVVADWLRPMVAEQRALAVKGDANNDI